MTRQECKMHGSALSELHNKLKFDLLPAALAEETLELANILEASRTLFALFRLLIFTISLLIYQIDPGQCRM